MKILVYGANGWIGGQFLDVASGLGIQTVAGTSRADDYEEVQRELTSVQPTHVISLIGRTHGAIGSQVYSTIDYLEQKGKLEDNIRDNLYSPILLALACQQNSIHYTYLGTGCIFTYDDEHPFGKERNGFLESSKPNFMGSSYSIVKGFTDRLMQIIGANTLNLRIRMPISAEPSPRNFITKITRYEKICSIPNSMTVLPDMLPLVFDMLAKKRVGTLNLTNPGLISHNEILELYRDIVDSEFTWQNFSKAEQDKILAADRSNNFLDTTKLQGMYPKVQNIRDSVAECLKAYRDNLTRVN